MAGNMMFTQYGRSVTLYGWNIMVKVMCQRYVSKLCVKGGVRHLNYHPVAILSVQQGLDPAGNNYLT